MLRVDGKRLRWKEHDVERMAAIIGPDAADSLRSPVIPSIIKAADKRRIKLHSSARALLKDEIAVRRMAQSLKELEDWDGLRKAFPHQRADLHYMREMGLTSYLLAHQTGVGKTLSALLFVHQVAHTERNLIVTKNLAKEQWHDAIKHFIGRKEVVRIVDGKLDEQHDIITQTETGWVIAHWEAVQNLPLAFLARPWGSVIGDEVQFMTNRKVMRAMALHRVRTKYRVAATAHPYTNDPAELFSILRFLFPKIYRSYWQFFFMHVKASPKFFGGYEIEGAKRPKLLRWELEPFTLRRTKQEVFKGLPRISSQRTPVRLTDKGRREYEKLRRQIFVELDAMDGGTKVLPIINDLSRVTRCRQYLIDPAILGAREKSVKYEQTLDLLDMIDAPTVIFTEWKKSALGLGAFLRKRNKKMRIDFIHGGMKKVITAKKKAFVRGETDALIVVAKAGDTALNLGGHGYLIHLDLPFTPRDYEQRQGRVDRPEEGTGRLVPTTEYRIICTDTYEERMEAKLIKKDDAFQGVFTVRDLRRLFE